MLRQFIGKRTSVTLITVGFLLLLAMSAASILLVRYAGDSGDRVERSMTINNLITVLRADLRRAESGQRGYLLTGDRAYLDDYEAARANILPALDSLEQALAGEAGMADHLAHLHQKVIQKLDEMAQTVGLAKEGRLPEAIALVNTDRGLGLMDEIRTHASAILTGQQQLLSAQTRDSDRAQLLLFVFNIGGAFIVAALAIVSILLVRRSARATLAANAALENANEALEQRVAARTADLQSMNDEVQRFAYIVGHDLRSPLVNIMGFTSELEMLGDRLAPRPAEGEDPTGEAADLRRDFDESLGFIKSSIAKMARLINVILQLSRSGKRTFNPRHLDLGEVIGGLVAEAGKRAADLGAEITLGALPSLVSDRPALEQIFGNLLDNAIKYLRPGMPGRIAITGREQGSFVFVSISDNGRGIAAADLDRVFDLFRRAGPQDRPGEGIGLAHVRALTRSLGGSVRLESRLGEGSSFTVVLPKLWTPAAAPSDKAEEA